MIYCDLDNTIADFYIKADECLSAYNLPSWSDSTWLTRTDRTEEFKWSVIRRFPNFWLDLPFMPGGEILWENIKEYKPYILSHAVDDKFPNTTEQKIKWVEKHLKIDSTKAIIVSERIHKLNYTINRDGTPNILIDDYEKTCIEWENKGGIAIHHINVNKTLKTLRSIGYN